MLIGIHPFSRPNFTGTKCTKELCVGVVKAAKVFPKNQQSIMPMLCKLPELQSAFLKSSSQPKRIECVRVDGVADEGPSHDEVKYYWRLGTRKASYLSKVWDMKRRHEVPNLPPQ